MKKRNIYILIFILTILFLPIIIEKGRDFVLIKSKITCARIYGDVSFKSAQYYEYYYIVEGKRYYSRIIKRDLRKLNLNDYKKNKCIRVKYSTLFKWVNNVVDKNILK
jgi:hypothetical protein